ncbi:MAG: hypothetical protein AO396_01445 [Candidatus Fermentibacter daniensis]|nr:MAG: hypothetical protein AO396_01445 [Candidatus Fermentibacter daniensis]
MESIRQIVVTQLRKAASHNPDVSSPPVCILWPDHEGVWGSAISALQGQLPELFVLGAYDPEKRTGPAIWLRCVLARKLEGASIPVDLTPIFYLPGVSRSDLRAIESCREELKPLAELQYLGVVWSHPNGKDWTPQAFLKVACGIETASDNATKDSVPRALPDLLDLDVAALQGRRIDAAFLNKLVIGGDPVRDILKWMDRSDSFRSDCCDAVWAAFVETCKAEFSFSPSSDDILLAAERLAEHKDKWKQVWERFCEAPDRYPSIPGLIGKCPMPAKTDFFTDAAAFEGWPQWNEEQEKNLLGGLAALKNVAPSTAREKILELESDHGSRRSTVWGRLGMAPLATALEHLAVIAAVTKNQLASGNAEELAGRYSNAGWKADDAVLKALASRGRQDERAAIEDTVRAIYLPWLEDSAHHLQKLAEDGKYPFQSSRSGKPVSCEDGCCLVFVDGLRMDAGQRLISMLEKQGFDVTGQPIWSALPSVTATAKPAVLPAWAGLAGPDASADFEPVLSQGSKSIKGSQIVRKQLESIGWQILDENISGTVKGNAWCEAGDIDKQGHDSGLKLAASLDAVLAEVAEKVSMLLSSGWPKVRIVTDHGWLLMPGGLPKSEMASFLAESKWGRCAAMKAGAQSNEKLYGWFWNPAVHFALAPGVSCYRANMEYAHGGISLQECLTLQLTVQSRVGASSLFDVRISNVRWVQQRCHVSLQGITDGLLIDIREAPSKPDTSLLVGPPKQVSDPEPSFVVDDSHNGKAALVVLVDANGNVVTQVKTVVGGGLYGNA